MLGGMNVKLIDQKLVAECLKMPRAIELVKSAYADLTEGNVDSPLRTALVNEGGTVLYKPAYGEGAGIFCVKVVSVFADNVNKGLPVTPGIIVVNSAETGMPLAILEAGYLTALRTGAATGIATKVMAPEDSKVGALFGTGGQSRHQLEAMLCARSFERIYVFSRQEANAIRFCEKNRDIAGDCELIANPDRKVLKECDVITTSTTSPTAIFSDEEISDSVHINAIGSLGAQRTEISAETLLRSDVVVDQRAACLAEAGEICLMRDAGLIDDDYCPVEIGELILGKQSLGERNKPTVFKSVGNAAQDLVCSAEIYRYALDQGLGVDAVL
ncbi:delta(1)-pyrroline-2-carboxylate reductase [Rubritalea halochordaticola]|uniref:Delta(1)-pyrroline-2-carboxylate reductase n=1 Tax=Rubritalea halochordaticola TaxID=714537 RepID=A0ABP9UXJ4_9BACT